MMMFICATMCFIDFQVCVMPCRAVCVERVSHLCGTLICSVCVYVCGVSGLCGASTCRVSGFWIPLPVVCRVCQVCVMP